MNQTVLEAKNEFEAFGEGKVRTLGLEGFKDELLKLLQKGGIAALESKDDQP